MQQRPGVVYRVARRPVSGKGKEQGAVAAGGGHERRLASQAGLLGARCPGARPGSAAQALAVGGGQPLRGGGQAVVEVAGIAAPADVAELQVAPRAQYRAVEHGLEAVGE